MNQFLRPRKSIGKGQFLANGTGTTRYTYGKKKLTQFLLLHLWKSELVYRPKCNIKEYLCNLRVVRQD